MNAPSTATLLAIALAWAITQVACARAATPDATPGADASISDDDYAERMAIEHADDLPHASGAGVTLVGDVAVVEDEVVYTTLDGQDIRGFLAAPIGAPPTAGVLVIHEWWGLNDNIREMTRGLAAEGYLALAVDLYGGESAADPGEARPLMEAAFARVDWVHDNLRGARAYLSSAGIDHVGVIGWCFGGVFSLESAIVLGEDIAAAVVYYGRVETDPTRLANLRAPVLGFFGGLDNGIPLEHLVAFEAAMIEAGAALELHLYPDADHAFANPSGNRFRADDANRAWRRTLEFFSTHLNP